MIMYDLVITQHSPNFEFIKVNNVIQVSNQSYSSFSKFLYSFSTDTTL